MLTDDPLRLITALKPRPSDQTPLTLLIGDVANEGTMFINGLQVRACVCLGVCDYMDGVVWVKLTIEIHAGALSERVDCFETYLIELI